MATSAIDLHALEEELKKIGISIVSGRQDTIISIQIKGLHGKTLVRGLQLADQLLQAKVKHVLKTFTDSSTSLFSDPTFGPTTADPSGADALCKNGSNIPSKGGSPHQVKVLGLLKSEKIRWERPIYLDDDNDAGDNQAGEDDENEPARSTSDNVFATSAQLFADGVSSGDVIQGNLGDCWFLSALSVVATRSDLLEQTFWQGDKHKGKGLFVCRFMKNFVWNYVVIDDRFPVFGFSKTKEGKPYFARCRDPNELWVSLLEKAYAKLHGSYEALIGGFIDVALNDLTGMCSEQVIMKSGFPGFGEDPLAPAKPNQKRGDPFWLKLLRYKKSGTLMGCSIQPIPTTDKNVAAESSAGNGLYYKHAYALVDAAEIRTQKQELVRLVKLRNPWGMGEWTGPWSDTSEERSSNQDIIEQFFKVLKRNVGGNANKRVFLSISGKGELKVDEISQDEVVDLNANDGTFFMAFDAWTEYFTHFFAGIDFPDEWHGRRVEGCWNEANCGGNTTKSTWLNNPHCELVLEERCQLFISLSQEDPRGKEHKKIVPVGFHVCSLVEVSDKSSKFEIKEPPGKTDSYYRLYKEKDRVDFQKGIRPETLPPAIIPGSVLPGIDDDGVPQPAYTFKQAVSVDVTMDAGKYCIIPSMYMRTDKDTGKTNVGSFWISVYSSSPKFRLEGGETIAEEEEGEFDNNGVGFGSSTRSGHDSPASSPSKKSETLLTDEAAAVDNRRKFEDAKEELLAIGKERGIGIRELKMEFAKAQTMKKSELKKRLLAIGFKMEELTDERINTLFVGLDVKRDGSVPSDRIVNMFEAEIQEDQMACEVPEVEDDDVPEKLHQEGILQLEVRGAKDLCSRRTSRRTTDRKVDFPDASFSLVERRIRRNLAKDLCERYMWMHDYLRPFLKKAHWVPSVRSKREMVGNQHSQQDRQAAQNPVATFYDLLEQQYAAFDRNATSDMDEVIDRTAPRTPIYSRTTTMTSSQSTPKIQPLSKLGASVTSLHVSERMKTLEQKRADKLLVLQKKKREALGDKQKTSLLPRLIGGSKCGSNHARCVDCGRSVRASGRSEQGNQAVVCSGYSCVSVFCERCASALPDAKKLCENCFQHELVPVDAVGERLRTLLIEKLDSSEQSKQKMDEVFRRFDKDGSGALSPDELTFALRSFSIQPPLTDTQIDSLLHQFDTNKDGLVSMEEFRAWVVKDQIWSPATGEPRTGANANLPSTFTQESPRDVVSSLLEDVFQTAYDAFLLASSKSEWIVSLATSKPGSARLFTQPRQLMAEETSKEDSIFERVVHLKLSHEAGDSGAAVSQAPQMIFERFDVDHSGKLDVEEFTSLLQTLGLHAQTSDVRLLMHRLEKSSDVNDSIDYSEFTAYVEGLANDSKRTSPASVQTESLVSTLVNLQEIARASPNQSDVQDILQQLQWSMRESQVVNLCRRLRRLINVRLDVNELVRISNALYFREVQPSRAPAAGDRSSNGNGDREQLLALRNSGDVLNTLLFSSTPLMDHVKSLDVHSVCDQLRSFLEDNAGAQRPETIWKLVFAKEMGESMDQRDFLDSLLGLGFKLKVAHGDVSDLLQRICCKTLIGLTLDALRCEAGLERATDSTSGLVTFNLLMCILRRQKINEIETQFRHALKVFLDRCHGHQAYLVTALIDQEDQLVIKARDPVSRHAMKFALASDEYKKESLMCHRYYWELPRSRGSNSRSCINSVLLPKLDDAMMDLMARLRVNSCSSLLSADQDAYYLTLVESDRFVQHLRNLLDQAHLPFFWSVSHQSMDFSIDADYLSQLCSGNFQQLVALALTRKSAPRSLLSLIKHSSSSLSVRYDILGKNITTTTTWAEFQALLSGHQDLYALVELRPQGDTFATKIDRTGQNGAPSWNFKQNIFVREPDSFETRIDGVVVYTDTLQVRNPPSASETKTITFVTEKKAVSGHFVVVSVRKTQPTGKDNKVKLYCTAYDPFSSSDYMVLGFPENWSMDFFNPKVNPDYERKWIELVQSMRLGPTLTPKLLIKVFNKQPKTEKLVGECEVSLASAMAHEGHLVEDWFPLLDPVDPANSAGSVSLSFRFDTKRARDVELEEALVARVAPKLLVADTTASSLESSKEKNTSRVPSLQDESLRALKASLEETETAKHAAEEQVKNLKSQLQILHQQVSARADGEITRWKRRVEQSAQEHATQVDEYNQRISALTEEIKQLEASKAKTRPVEPVAKPTAVVSNMKQANLGTDASAHDILAAMKEILVGRCPERPYNGLKKALAAIADQPGKVALGSFEEVLTDFGLALSASHWKSLLDVLDPEDKGRVNIEDFFVKLCGDADAYRAVAMVKPPSVATEPREPEKAAPAVSPLAAPISAKMATVPSKPKKLSWKELRQLMVLNLPEGWEMRYTEKGRPYFCNHADRSTQWKHPKPEIESKFTEWIKENGLNFTKSSSQSKTTPAQRG